MEKDKEYTDDQNSTTPAGVENNVNTALDALSSLDDLYDEDKDSEEIATEEYTPQITQTDFYGRMEILSEYVNDCFQSLSVIDSYFGKIAKEFSQQAERYAEALENSKRASEQEEYLAGVIVNFGISMAVTGVGNIMKIGQINDTIDRYKAVGRSIAADKGDSIDQMCEMAAQMSELAYDQLPGDYISMKNIASLENDGTLKCLTSALNRYRNAEYLRLQMEWLRRQIKAWKAGLTGDAQAKYPSLGDLNSKILHIVASHRGNFKKEDLNNLLSTIEGVLKGGNNNVNMVRSDILMVINDQALLATLIEEIPAQNYIEMADAEDYPVTLPLQLLVDAESNSDKGPISEHFMKSDAIMKVTDLDLEARRLSHKLNKHMILMLLNGVLFSLIPGIPLFFSDIKWGWIVFWYVVILIVSLYFAAKPIRNLHYKVDARLSMMWLWRQTLLNRLVGYNTEMKTVHQLVGERNKTLAGGCIGGLIGMMFGPLWAILGALFGASLGSSEDSEPTDGHNYGEMPKGSYATTVTWTVILLIIDSLILMGSI